ncbi:MAG: 3-hydroxyacyl-CoA dehydrogenase family protein [Candidatus Micrarchaeota archaeon]|nr:3-hydroxyacyl-CoA dehydrogenase family protein [Candidatus Micrarchaeota archaeon]MDE1848235.1 3-hydroxyacyl-CoA dehydrogenase family protein [Candidatus Micrarchaeota archaeon]MDE1864878.1 3-hydroxyacyl-CoA dehydrogenase family protein [Candidatus Micrarchaeota archaeon]
MRIKNITVLGSGTMGHGIAQVAAMSGYKVSMRDTNQEYLDAAMDKIANSLATFVSKHKISEDNANAAFSKISPQVELKAALKDSDMVIEAVPETLEIKKATYLEVDSFSEKKTIYASNTSTLPIAEVASYTSRPEKFIGVHFFNPPQVMKLVEVIPGEKTSRETTSAVMDFVKSASKEPILCKKDVPGFIVNRIFIPFVHEATWAMERTGASILEIDSAVKFKLHFPMGIFELADFTGIDIVHNATEQMHLRDKVVVNPHPLIKKLYDKKMLGQKTGSGFYVYPDPSAKPELSEGMASCFDPTHILGTILNNAGWLISNNVANLMEIEKTLSLGMRLQRPLFDTAEEFGISNIVSELKALSRQHGPFYKPDPYLASLSI